MADEIFTPFTPGTAPVPTVPVETPAATPAAKTPRRSRRAAAQSSNEQAGGTDTPVPIETIPVTPRRRRTSPAKVRTPAGIKLPINMMLSVMGGLKADDGPLFEKLLGILNGAGKGQRERVLAALEKVFS